MTFRNFCLQQSFRDDDYGMFCRNMCTAMEFGWVGVNVTWAKLESFLKFHAMVDEDQLCIARTVWIDFAALDL